jgi:hypothetical protein
VVLMLVRGTRFRRRLLGYRFPGYGADGAVYVSIFLVCFEFAFCMWIADRRSDVLVLGSGFAVDAQGICRLHTKYTR